MDDLTDIEILQKVLANLEILDRFSDIIEREDTRVIDGKFEHLDLSDLDLTEVPAEIAKFDSLITLDLSHNYLDTLPEFFLEMAQLGWVNIEGNNFPDNDWAKYVKDNPFYSIAAQVLHLRKDKECSWCGKAVGYRTEQGKQSGLWGFSNHYITMLICNSCSHVEQFYGNKSIL